MNEPKRTKRVILVAMDNTKPSRLALSFAGDLIKGDPSAELHTVHVVTPAYRTSHEEVRTRDLREDPARSDARAEAELPTFYAETLRMLGPRVVGHVRFGR